MLRLQHCRPRSCCAGRWEGTPAVSRDTAWPQSVCRNHYAWRHTGRAMEARVGVARSWPRVPILKPPVSYLRRDILGMERGQAVGRGSVWAVSCGDGKQPGNCHSPDFKLLINRDNWFCLFVCCLSELPTQVQFSDLMGLVNKMSFLETATNEHLAAVG